MGEKLPNMTGVRIQDIRTGETSTVDAAGMFLAMGIRPTPSF